MLAAFTDLFQNDNIPIPKSLRFDKGLEFQNTSVKTYLASLGIKQFTAKNQVKKQYSGTRDWYLKAIDISVSSPK